MFDNANKMLLAGLGAVTMTRDRAEKIFDTYVRRGKAERSDRTGFVRDMMDATDKAQHELENLVGKEVRQVISSLDLVTREDLARLEAKLDELLGRGS